MRKSKRHFWAILGNFGQFWVIFGPFWIILGHSRVIWRHLGSYFGHFGPFWVIFSRDSRETLKYGTFGRKKFGFRAMSRRILKLCVASLLNILCFPDLEKFYAHITWHGNQVIISCWGAVSIWQSPIYWCEQSFDHCYCNINVHVCPKRTAWTIIRNEMWLVEILC